MEPSILLCQLLAEMAVGRAISLLDCLPYFPIITIPILQERDSHIFSSCYPHISYQILLTLVSVLRNMTACVAFRKAHRWHSELPLEQPEQASNSEDTEAQKDLSLTEVTDALRTLRFTHQEEDESKNVVSRVFVVGDYYMHLELRNEVVVWATAGERQVTSTDAGLSSQVPATRVLLHC
jgi:hypothetical protein